MNKANNNFIDLVEICNPKQWTTISTENFTESGFPVYGANGKIGFYSEYNHDTPTLLITCRGATCGSLNICEPFSYINGNAMALDNLSDNVNISYLYYFLSFRGFDDVISGSAQPQITRQGLTKIKIPLLPLEEQHRIVKILDLAQSLIEKRKQAISYLDDYIKAVFLDMFGDPVSNPKGWERVKLGSICNIRGGKRIPKGSQLTSENTGFPYIKAGNIKDGKVTSNNLEFLSPELREKLIRYTVEKGDVCITVVGVNIGDIGIVPEELHMANLTENANKLLIKEKEKLNNVYMAHYLMLDSVQNQFISNIRASGVPKLALFRIEQIELLIPPIDIQNRYRDLYEKTESLKQKMQAHLKELENNFQAELQRAFRGE